jgi:glycosyltransferase involved in cell wall biosynthesis
MTMKKTKILLIQPIIPHYRTPFLDRVSQTFNLLVLYGRSDSSFQINRRTYIKKVKSINVGKSELFFVFHELIRLRPDVVITYGEIKQISNIILILLKKIMKYKLVIWSHGFKEKKLTFADRVRLFEMRRSDGVLFYTESCFKEAKKYKIKNSYYLNNTLDMGNGHKKNNGISKKSLKKKYKIETRINGIFISRFTKVKAPELLLEIMIESHSKNNEIGFIVIGDGECKPNFLKYDFIYDFGRVYDDCIKSELFQIADFALMPRWIGLSIIECFAHSLPMFTLSNEIEYIEHSVEYSYLKHNRNGYIAKDIKDLTEKISNININEIKTWGCHSYDLVTNHFTMGHMVENFSGFINAF